MAQAELKTAPTKPVAIKIGEGEFIEEVVENSKEHKALSKVFDPLKKYMFELVSENPEREFPVIDMRTKRPAPHTRFKPYQSMVFTSQVVWNGQRRMIRYYDGCGTIFADKQPKDKETLEQLIKQSTKRQFLDGKFGCYGDDRMLLLYLNICSWNVESPFRTRTADGIFKSVNPDVAARAESAKLDETETALKYAKEATEIKMRIHANYLGIPTVDFDSGNELTEAEIRTEYRKEALRNSASFIESYGNRSIEVKYFIEKALEGGIISNKFNPNKATWGGSNTEICDISGLKSSEAIAQRLYEFSQSEEGEEFVIQLKAVSESA